MKKPALALMVFASLLGVSHQSIAKTSTPPPVRIQKISDTIYRLTWPVSDFIQLRWTPDLVNYYPISNPALQIVGNDYVTEVTLAAGTERAYFTLTAVE